MNDLPFGWQSYPFKFPRKNIAIDGSVIYNDCHIDYPLDGRSIVSIDEFNFRSNVFWKPVYLWNSKFYKKTSFLRDTFDDSFIISLSNFFDEVSFQENTHRKSMVLNYNVFNHAVQFRNSTYNSVSIANSIFKSDAIFEFNTFNANLILSGSTFNRTLRLADSKLSGRLDLSKIILGDFSTVDVSRSILPDTLDFSIITRIPTMIDLTVANYTGESRHYINLAGTDASKFLLEYKFFKLYFPQQMRTHSRLDIYEKLLERYNGHSKDESYSILYAEYKKLQHPYISWIPHLWWNFGNSGARVFIWLGLLLFSFTWLVYKKYDFFCKKIYEVKIDKQTNTFFHNILAAFIYSLTLFRRPFQIEKHYTRYTGWYILIYITVILELLCLYCLGVYITTIAT